jgi:uncharacterized protein YjdB
MKSEKKVKSHFLTVGILLVLAILLLTLNAGAVGRKGSSSNVNVNPISAEKKALSQDISNINPIQSKKIISAPPNSKIPDDTDSSNDMSGISQSSRETTGQTGRQAQVTQGSPVSGKSYSNTYSASATTTPKKYSTAGNQKSSSLSGSAHKSKQSNKTAQPKPIKKIIPISGLSISRSSLSLKKGQTAQLAASVSPADTTQDKAISWTSSNSKIATVGSDGTVTAVEGGKATITAASSNGKTASCTVTVSVPLSSITISRSSLSLEKGQTAQLNASISPTDTTDSKAISWTSSDSKVASVSPDGTVTAVEGGKATITAASSNGKTASCAVTVSVPIVSVKLDMTDIALEKGESRVLTATVMPSDTTDSISWTSSDSSVVSVDSYGKITAAEPGTATITASAGNVSASCRVSVGISISRIVLDKTNITLIKGSRQNLKATIEPEDTTESKTVTWSSSDPSVATVDSNGKITAVEGGTAIITAQAGRATAQCKVTVIVPVTGVTLEKPEVTMERGSSQTLKTTVTPEDATNKAIDWVSSDESVAAVDDNGKVIAKSIGQAVITAKTADGGFTAHCKIAVVVSISEIRLNKTSVTLKKGEIDTLSAVVLPKDTTEDKTVAWLSSNEKVAAVDKGGKITAVEGGTAVITAKAGRAVAQCQVTVTVSTAGISFDKESLTLERGSSQTLKATITPEDATNKAIDWVSDNPDVVTVDSNGIVTAKSIGQAVITAKTADDGFTAHCKIDVIVSISGIKLDKTNATIKKGETDTLSAVVLPEDTTEDKTVAWSSSNEKVAAVDKDGKITAVDGGTAVITAKAANGKFTAQCQVTVIVPVTGIAFANSKDTIGTGVTKQLSVVFTPENATDKTLIWESSNPSIISIDQQGNIKANADNGTVVITVTSRYGGFQAQCEVTIQVTPSAPQNLSAAMSNNTQMKITWDKPDFSGTSDISKYVITTNDSEHTVNANAGNSLTINCPTDASTLTITAYAVNASGNGDSVAVNYKIDLKTGYKLTDYDVWEIQEVHEVLQDGRYQLISTRTFDIHVLDNEDPSPYIPEQLTTDTDSYTYTPLRNLGPDLIPVPVYSISKI